MIHSELKYNQANSFYDAALNDTDASVNVAAAASAYCVTKASNNITLTHTGTLSKHVVIFISICTSDIYTRTRVCVCAVQQFAIKQ